MFEDTPAPRLTSSTLTLGLVLLRLFVFTVYMTCYYIHTYSTLHSSRLNCSVLLNDSVNVYATGMPLGSLMPIEFRP